MTKTNVQPIPSNSQHHDTPNNKSHQRATIHKCRAESIRALAPDKNWNFGFLARLCHGGTIKGACV